MASYSFLAKETINLSSDEDFLPPKNATSVEEKVQCLVRNLNCDSCLVNSVYF